MQGGGPTIPNIPQYSQESSPSWPIVRRHEPQLFGAMNGPVLVASLTANVVLLIGLFSLLLLGKAGFFSSSHAAPSVPTSQVALSSPTVAATLTPSPNASSLQVSPTSVTLGCGDGQHSQSVVLVNNGSDRVQWQAQYSQSSDQSAVVVSPDHGDLRAGTSLVLHVQSNDTGGGQGSTQQGTIQFVTDNQTAGSSAVLNYTAPLSCG